MTRPLSEDRRLRVIAAVDGGLSPRAAEERFGVACQRRTLDARMARKGRDTRKPQGGDKRSHRIEAYRNLILGVIEQQVGITLIELVELQRKDHRVVFATSTLLRFLDRHAMTSKKTAHASEQERSDVAAR